MPATKLLFIGASATDPAAGASLAETDQVQRPGLYTATLTLSSSILPLDLLMQVRRAGTTLSSLIVRLTTSPFNQEIGSFVLAKGDTIRIVNRNAVVGEVNARIGLS